MRRFSWLDIIIILLFLFSVYLILTRIFGNSASDLSIIVSLFGLFGSLVTRVMYAVYHLNREIGEFKIKTAHGFQKVKDDMDFVKSGTELLKSDMSLIKKKLRV